MSLFDDAFYLGIGAMARMKKGLENLVEQGKISREEAQRMFEDLKNQDIKDEKLTPLSLALGFSMYTQNRIKEMLDDLQQAGKISANEAKKYYEKYVPQESEEKEKPEFATREDLANVLKKLEEIQAKLEKE
ncbi:MAG TPA: hypothetical protein P5560_01885 [Thermotogota bacterium]|nr:hypothetical protein [Thermotogota bacterium]HRW91678.1 hypothetical protein [Thermotogota bacterium]